MESLVGVLPPIPKISSSTGEKDSKSKTVKERANYQESKLSKQKLPRQQFLIQNIKGDKEREKFRNEIEDTTYTGDKLYELRENDMVCKLVYGQLNRSVEVSKKDFKFLEPGVYLNDILILFYLRFLQYYVIPKPLEQKVHICDPQFFTKLQEQPQYNAAHMQ